MPLGNPQQPEPLHCEQMPRELRHWVQARLNARRASVKEQLRGAIAARDSGPGRLTPRTHLLVDLGTEVPAQLLMPVRPAPAWSPGEPRASFSSWALLVERAADLRPLLEELRPR